MTAAMLVVCVLVAAPAGAQAQGHSWRRDADRYYVEFRADENGVYGHSYIAFGRLNARGQPITAAYADIHPAGDLPSMVLGHFLPVDALTVPDPTTPRRPIVSHFRVPLSTGGYRRLLYVIARIRSADHAWSVIGYNCNDFVADVAEGLGMRVPSTLLFPYEFIPELRAINALDRGRAAYASSARRRIAVDR